MAELGSSEIKLLTQKIKRAGMTLDKSDDALAIVGADLTKT